MIHVRPFLPLCCLLTLCVILTAQEQGQYAPSEKEAAELGPKNKAFMEALTEFRELNKKLTALKVENQDASPKRRKEIETEHPKLYRQGVELHKKAIALALDAHEETPNRNPSVSNLLYSTVAWEFNRGNYEESVRLFKRLAASGMDKGTDRYYVYAGFAALLSMNFDEAEDWLTKAEKSGKMEEAIKEWVTSKSGQSLVENIQGPYMAMSQTKEAWAKEQQIRKAETEAGEHDPAKKLPRVELLIGKDRNTVKGKIVLELFENEAPNTVANFISLVDRGFYDGIVFHRVLEAFMAQGGDPTGSSGGGPGYQIDDECGSRFPQYRRHFRGSISMANSGPNTNGSQFFLTFIPASHLDGKYTVFGRVVEGIDVLADIQRVDPKDKERMVPELDRIVEAKVLNKRNHPYEVKKNRGR
ncbi:MAG: peptidylprolyl isomerase [Planctomycetaceae bacterium]|jgi:cyclophilin family peptidyl-prolyl cis-trans isomerase|nr:peptidylprolyl isomerase [Planctomycetaceae bacterium]